MTDSCDAELKHRLRRQFRRARMQLPAGERRRAETRINRRLKSLLKRGRRIAFYWPVGSELRLDALMQTALARGTHVYLPYIEAGKRRLWFTRYRPDARRERRRAGRLDIPQFKGQKVRMERIDCVLLPLVAADRQGYRLGQGGGFYDASLAHCRFSLPKKIGVGFACQLADALPHEPHDKPLDAFVCEQAWLTFKRRYSG